MPRIIPKHRKQRAIVVSILARRSALEVIATVDTQEVGLRGGSCLSCTCLQAWQIEVVEITPGLWFVTERQNGQYSHFVYTRGTSTPCLGVEQQPDERHHTGAFLDHPPFPRCTSKTRTGCLRPVDNTPVYSIGYCTPNRNECAVQVC